MPLLDVVMKEPRPLVILAEKVDGAALGMLVHNAAHGTLEAIAVRAPGFGHRRIAHLKDLAAFTGGEVITDEAGLTLANVKREYLGSARRVIVTEHALHVRRGRGLARRRSTHAARADPPARPSARRTRTTARSRASGWPSWPAKLAVIHVGAATDVVLNEKRHRTEGALAATRAAVAEGIVPGGGTALLRAETRARRPRARGRLRDRRRPRAHACSPSRCSGSPPTPATTARPRSTRCGRCPRAPG